MKPSPFLLGVEIGVVFRFLKIGFMPIAVSPGGESIADLKEPERQKELQRLAAVHPYYRLVIIHKLQEMCLWLKHTFVDP